MTNEGFDPIVGTAPKVLILGTFPSEESLKQQQYYAHPRNVFWEIIAGICGTGATDDYKKRCDLARNGGIAIWDVLKSCDREGSSDGQIKQGHFIANDFSTFLSKYSFVAIFFNGQKAARLFKQHVEPALLPALPQLVTLPSTSPAYATISKQQKLECWLKVGTYLSAFQHTNQM
ncbi:MAG: DNA-deoxyinosine glycosylase [Geobacteraceae bacterium]|nr:DNA-deoxyinosine glycosylase [Geobacteraceae bacterium]NTW80657.1 DNA-deoxyinosine glycosylase [Geobacteraceae bacterium]